MKKQISHFFSILELLIVVSIMAILAIMIFVVVKGVKDGAKTVETEATIKTCKASVENLYNFIFNQTRANSMEVYVHPLFSKVWPSNKAWTFRDKDESDKGFTSNGLMNMINIGNLGVENKSIATMEIKYSDSVNALNTLIDGWGNPIVLIRNETPWFIKQLNPGDNKIDLVFKNRTKTSMGFYIKYNTSINGTNQNLYEWNDASFNHTDSKGVLESSIEIAPLGNDGYRKVAINGKIAVPYNNNDFDFFSPGKDGKIGNFIRSDMKQDRWSEVLNNNGTLKWVPATLSVTDPDQDNIVTFNRFFTE